MRAVAHGLPENVGRKGPKYVPAVVGGHVKGHPSLPLLMFSALPWVLQCVRVTHGEPDVEWESGYNHALAVPEAGVATITADVAWGTHVDVTAEPLVDGKEVSQPGRNTYLLKQQPPAV